MKCAVISLQLESSSRLKINYLHIGRFFCLLCLASVLGCNSKGFQNLNARYNGYFYANQYVNEVYTTLEENYQYNFNDVLKVFPEIDSATIGSNKEKLDDAFKKLSQNIEWYKASDWTDDSYLLIGKIRHLRGQFQLAIDTFQYIIQNSKDPKTRQAAAIALMRTYLDMREFDLVVEVSQYLENEERLTQDNAIDYYALLAYYHQIEGNEEGMQAALERVSRVIPNKDQKARTNFILGQLSQRAGDNAKAGAYYDIAMKGTPPYELLFHSRLNRMAVRQYTSQTAIDKAYKEFGKLLEDGKNVEYQDAIYYVMGQMEQKRSNFEDAIINYGLATTVPQPNQRQQGLSYLRLGEIYFDEYENYKLSSLYYDSAVAKLPSSEEGYEAISEKQQVLKEFVTQLNIIELNDSLLALAEMNPVSLDAYLDRYLDEQEEEEKQKAKAAKKSSSSNTAVSSTNTDTSGDNSWYFYNDAAISQGQLEFQRNWGGRPLEDNWRRSSKNSIGVGLDPSLTADAETDDQALEEEQIVDDGREALKAELIKGIPRSQEEKDAAYAKMAEAYFKLGDVYRYGLNQEGQSIASYEKLLERFPQNEFRLQTLFNLHNLYLTRDAGKAENYKQLIIQEFPETLIAKTLVNPRYLEEKAIRTRALEDRYAQAYNYYESGDFLKADEIVHEILNSFEDVDFLPTVELLAAILKSRTESLVSYEQALNDFIAKYPSGETTDYAKKLLAAINPAKEEVVASLGTQYSEDFKQLHMLAIIFDTKITPLDRIQGEIENFNGENFPNSFLNIGSLTFDEDASLAILFVNPLKTKSAAERYKQAIQATLTKVIVKEDVNFHNFAISRDNFTKLFETKNLEDYLSFSNKFYK